MWIPTHIVMRDIVKTIQMTIDEQLLADVDEATQALHTTRSAFIRTALQLALRQHEIARLERQHERGYTLHPVKPGEFDVWEAEQFWGLE